MKVYEHWEDFPMDEWRWSNFSPQEMACRGDDKLAIDEGAMDKLQALRTALGRPLIINSAYRSPEYNKSIGGATRSQHKLAKAFDVSMSNQEPGVFISMSRKAGFTGFGYYRRNNFIHIDTGPSRQWGARWFPEETASLPAEKPLHPETATEDKALMGSVVGAGGVITASGTALSAIGSLSPTAQVVAIVGAFVAIGALAFIMRHQIKRLLS